MRDDVRYVDDDAPTIRFARPVPRPNTAPTAVERRLWDANDVARFLQVSRSWVYSKAESGLLPVIRMPGSSLLRFAPEAIQAYARGEWTPAKAPQVHTPRSRK